MEKTRAGIQSVEVGFVLLATLAQASGSLMLRDLAALAAMSPAKAHRYLVSFQRLGLVVQDPTSTRYDLGPAALRLGLAALSRLDAVKIARVRAQGLALQLDHTVALAVWGNHGPTIVHWEESPQAAPVTLRLGDVMPLLSSATGRCFAAFYPAKATADLLASEMAQAKRLTRTDLPRSKAELAALLAEVRRHGLAQVHNTLLSGVAAVSAPVFDCDGHMALAIVALGSTATFDAQFDGKIAMAVRQAATELSNDLGLAR